MTTTIRQFADEFRTNNSRVKACHIAIVLIDGQYDLEVEVSEGFIGGTYRTEDADLEAARSLANQLDVELMVRGIRVFPTRRSWEIYLENKEVAVS